MLIATCAITAIAGGAQAATPFYQGKTLTLVVGSAAGGAGDLTCRLLAQYLGKHIAGEPTVIVKDMPGPDNMISANYIAREAKNDGLSALCGGLGYPNQLFHEPGMLADLSKLTYISGDGGAAMIYVRSDVAPGMKTRDDIFKAHGLIYGGLAANSLKDISTRAWFETLGLTDYKYVTGFSGDGPGRAAVQQKFVNLYQESMTSYSQVTVPTMIKSGEVLPLYQTGNLDSSGHPTVRDGPYKDIPTFTEFYKAKFGKTPSGAPWELGQTIISMVAVARDAIALPPNAPPDAAAALRAAIGPLNADPEFDADADKVMGPGTREAPARVVEQAVEGFLNMPAALVDYYKKLIDSGKSKQQKI